MNNIYFNDFDDVFDDFLGFGRARKLIFNSSVKDMMPSYWTKKDNNTYTCVVKTIGINPSDIQVLETECGIKVNGETELEGYKYNTSMELPIAQRIMNEVKEIKVHSKNGLTFITLILNKPEKKKINIIKE